MPKTWPHRIKQQILRGGIRVGLSGIRFLVRALPRKVGVSLGGYLGTVAFYLLSSERGRALKHIRLALGEIYSLQEQLHIIKTSFKNLGKSLFEVLYLSRLTRDEISQLVIFEGEDCLKNAAEQGHGVIYVTGHLGNWELEAAALAMRFQFAAVAAPIYDPWMEKVMIQIRNTYSTETIIRGYPGALRRLLSLLKSGGVVGILIDQDAQTDGVYVPFFGRPAYTPSGAAAVALRTGAAVVLGFILRQPNNQHRLVVKGPLRLIQTGNRDADIEANTATFTEMIEQVIRNYPEQWVWMHNRWKTVKGN